LWVLPVERASQELSDLGWRGEELRGQFPHVVVVTGEPLFEIVELTGQNVSTTSAVIGFTPLRNPAVRRRRGEPISTALVESAVDEVVAKRINKK
jgi:hypothetical protein